MSYADYEHYVEYIVHLYCARQFRLGGHLRSFYIYAHFPMENNWDMG